MHLARALDRGWRAAWAAGRARGGGRIALVRLERAGPAEVGLLTRLAQSSLSPMSPAWKGPRSGRFGGDRGHLPLLTRRTSDYTAVDGARTGGRRRKHHGMGGVGGPDRVRGGH